MVLALLSRHSMAKVAAGVHHGQRAEDLAKDHERKPHGLYHALPLVLGEKGRFNEELQQAQQVRRVVRHAVHQEESCWVSGIQACAPRMVRTVGKEACAIVIGRHDKFEHVEHGPCSQVQVQRWRCSDPCDRSRRQCGPDVRRQRDYRARSGLCVLE